MQKITKILSEKIDLHRQKIEDFFTQKFSKTPPLFYNSVDLRHSGLKIAPIDTNCFSAGFNNLSEISKKKAEIIVDEFFNKNFPNAKKILLIPENHTRNLRYLENVLSLAKILSFNKEVIIGSLIFDLSEKTSIDLENGSSITLHPVIKKIDKLVTKEGFEPDLIILNNDLTDGIPEILQNLTTPIMPTPAMGWHSRTKSHHFTIYNQLAEEMAQILEIDPWLISSMHESCDDVDFKEQKGMKCLADSVEKLLSNLDKKYQEYGYDEKPYCYIKADNGTYGIAVWPVFSKEDVLEINKKERNKMSTLKSSVKTEMVLVQEGIKTIDKISDKIAEPMIYLMNGQVVGHLFRSNETRDEKISLNTAGMNFFDLENLPQDQLKLGAEKNNIIEIYSLIARLAALAAAIENSQIL